MRAIAVTPGHPDTTGVIELPEPPESDGSILLRTRLIGICGTDLEIAIDGYGTPPPGEDRLVLGHESLGEVLDAPADSGFKPGDRIKVRLTCKAKSLRAEKGYGEVTWDTEITNQQDEIVASYDVLTMVSI